MSAHEAVEWVADRSGYEKAIVGRYHVIVWTGSQAVDLDDGFEVCEAYVPLRDREYPDGKMILGRRRLPTKDRGEAKAMALGLALERITEHEVPK